MDNERKNNEYPEIPEKYRIEYIGSSEDEQGKGKRTIYRTRHWHNLKLWWDKKGKHLLKTVLKIIFIIGIVTFFVWDIVSNEPADISTSAVDTNVSERNLLALQGPKTVTFDVSERNFPALQGPKTVTFKWEYEGSRYFMTEIFYKTVYDYYNSNPYKHCWEEKDFEICLKGFLEEAKEDDTISKIASKIEAISLKNGLKGDELLEFTVAFVQSIPYDEDRFELITRSNKLEDLYPRYPYEVLYDNKGVCSGKSFLATSLIKELDYGVAFFNYDPIVEGEVGHIAPAIKCPKGYSSYNSGYCYTETVGTGFKIGDIPINIDAGVPKTRTPIGLFEEESAFDFDELEDAEIYVIADGNSYQGIIGTVQIIQEIETLESEITRLDGVIISLDEGANQLENSVNYYEQQSEAAYRRHELLGDDASYNEYLRLYSQYESAYARYESKSSEYNREINKYNDLVDEYNALIEDFYK